MRDPNRFCIQKDCSGCDRVWKELASQDAVLGRLRATIEKNLEILDEEILRQKERSEYYEQQADLFQASGDTVSASKFRAMAEATTSIRLDWLETRKRLRGVG